MTPSPPSVQATRRGIDRRSAHVRRLHHGAARVCLAVGCRNAALRWLDRLLTKWPNDPQALASRSHLRAELGDARGAVADARALVTRHPGRRAADWFNLAYLLEAADELADAEVAFRHAVALDEQLDRAWYGLGLTLIRRGRPVEAMQALERSTRLQPMSPYAWYQLAHLHAGSQAHDEARRIIRHLQGFEPRVAAMLERETGLHA
jgi:tetratricopeptide (TPR) repeat protein